jgi:hypothetical protein
MASRVIFWLLVHLMDGFQVLLALGITGKFLIVVYRDLMLDNNLCLAH